MRAIWITKHGSTSVLEVRQTPDPEPGPGQVRVRARACGLNFAEIMARQGLYPDAPKPPTVVGYEVAGEVDALGAGVEDVAVGDRVAALCRFGGHADTVCVDAGQAFAMPDAMSFEEGAALPVVYLTAYHMLFEVARIQPGDSVLVHSAAGGVGTAVLQLCRTVDDVVTFGTASARKHDYVREHGCDHPIDYRTEDYAEVVRARTGGRGVKVVLDPLGGRDWKKGYDLLHASGVLVAFGFANMNTRGGGRSLLHVARQGMSVPMYTPMRLMNDNRAVAGVNLGHMWGETELFRRQGKALMALYEAGKIRPHVDATFPFSEAAEAHARLERGDNTGKIVLLPD